jgi:hypothetical protein
MRREITLKTNKKQSGILARHTALAVEMRMVVVWMCEVLGMVGPATDPTRAIQQRRYGKRPYRYGKAAPSVKIRVHPWTEKEPKSCADNKIEQPYLRHKRSNSQLTTGN